MAKTGTSAIQEYCYSHRGLLKKQGLIYPDNIDLYDSPRHNSFFHALRSGQENGWEKILRRARLRKHNIAVSTEAICVNLPSISTNIGSVLPASKAFDVKVFVVFRETLSFTRSLYKQCVINPRLKPTAASLMTPPFGTSLAFPDFLNLEWAQFQANRMEVVQGLERVFPSAEIVSLEYHSEILPSFLSDALGIQSDEPGVQKRENSSLPDVAIEILRQSNKRSEGFGDFARLLVKTVTGSNNHALTIQAKKAVPSEQFDCDLVTFVHQENDGLRYTKSDFDSLLTKMTEVSKKLLHGD